jgi:hypothetical protein
MIYLPVFIVSFSRYASDSPVFHRTSRLWSSDNGRFITVKHGYRPSTQASMSGLRITYKFADFADSIACGLTDFGAFHGNFSIVPWEHRANLMDKCVSATNEGESGHRNRRSVMAESVDASTWYLDSQRAALMQPRHGFDGAQYDDRLSSGGLAKTRNRTAYILQLASKCRAGAAMSPITVPQDRSKGTFSTLGGSEKSWNLTNLFVRYSIT